MDLHSQGHSLALRLRSEVLLVLGVSLETTDVSAGS